MCFSLAWIEQLAIWFVVVAVIIAILRLLLPWIASGLGIPIIAQVVEIILWGVVAIFVIYFCFALLACFSGSGLPLFPHPR